MTPAVAKVPFEAPVSGVPTPATPPGVAAPPNVPPLRSDVGQPTPATPPGSGEPTPAAPLEPLSPIEQGELAHPDANDPRFQYPDDPVAVPMKSQLPGRSAADTRRHWAILQPMNPRAIADVVARAIAERRARWPPIRTACRWAAAPK